MKRVRVALDESLVQELDRAAQALGTTRSAFTRDALRDALGRLREQKLERQHRAGYEKKPVQPGEFSDYLADLMAEVGPDRTPAQARRCHRAPNCATPKRQAG